MKEIKRTTKIKKQYPSNLICPKCHGLLKLTKKELVCTSCKNTYKIIKSIPNFCQKKEYWCNVSKEKMQRLNVKAEQTGNWSKAAKEIIPEYYDHMEPFDRADAQFLWPIDSTSRVLDAGSMWGGVTLPVSQYCKEIYAIDKTQETLEFLNIRAGQLGLNNIHTVATPIKSLPFPDNFFDLVILNGVLEWTAFNQELILEKHWGKKRTDSATYSKDPKEMQIDVLKELNRVLKPSGHIHLAIENRIGYQYFLGYPDDHVNIRFVCFLPRFIANAITKWKLNCEYRTYVYTIKGLRSILKESGFRESESYTVFPHYISPSLIIPFNLTKHWKKQIFDDFTFPLTIFSKMFPKNLLKFFSPSYILISRKNNNEFDVKQKQHERKIVQLFKKAGFFQSTTKDNIIVVKIKGRSGNYHSVNFLIYDKKKPGEKYFCKICRDKRYKDILVKEANTLKNIKRLLEKTEITVNIPKFLFFDTIDDVTFLITSFLDGKSVSFTPKKYITQRDLQKLDKSVQMAIKFLVKFQKITQIKNVYTIPNLLNSVKKQNEKIKKEKRITPKIKEAVTKLSGEIKNLDDVSIPICAVHGDFDFYQNILFDETEIRVVDFEHFEREGLPFLDIATLILNPIIMSYEKLEKSITLYEFIQKNRIDKYINKWLNLYVELMGLSKQIIPFIIPIAALEQQTKDYPYYRRPETFPMYKKNIFIELLSSMETLSKTT